MFVGKEERRVEPEKVVSNRRKELGDNVLSTLGATNFRLVKHVRNWKARAEGTDDYRKNSIFPLLVLYVLSIKASTH